MGATLDPAELRDGQEAYESGPLAAGRASLMRNADERSARTTA